MPEFITQNTISQFDFRQVNLEIKGFCEEYAVPAKKLFASFYQGFFQATRPGHGLFRQGPNLFIVEIELTRPSVFARRL